MNTYHENFSSFNIKLTLNYIRTLKSPRLPEIKANVHRIYIPRSANTPHTRVQNLGLVECNLYLIRENFITKTCDVHEKT